MLPGFFKTASNCQLPKACQYIFPNFNKWPLGPCLYNANVKYEKSEVINLVKQRSRKLLKILEQDSVFFYCICKPI